MATEPTVRDELARVRERHQAAWEFVQRRRLAPQLAPALDDLHVLAGMLEALDGTFLDAPFAPDSWRGCVEHIEGWRRKAAAWDALYGMVDAAQEMGHPLGVTRDLMADLMRRRREEGEDDVS